MLFTRLARSFGKYEHLSTTMRRTSLRKVYPPPGYNLQIPEDWTTKKFLDKIGMGCLEHGEEFYEVPLPEFVNFDTVGPF